MQLALAIFASLVGLVASVVLLVLLLAGSPNSSPQQLATIKSWMIATGVVGVLGLVGAVWLMIVRRPMPAAAVGGAPALFCIIAFIIMLCTQG